MKLKAYLLVLLTTFFWGFTFHLSKYLLKFVEPIQVAFFRFFYSSLFLFVFFIMVYKKRNPISSNRFFSKIKNHWKNILLMSFAGIFMFNFFIYKGIHLSNPVIAAIISAANPAITALLLRFWKKEPQSIYTIVGIVIAFVGILITLMESFRSNPSIMQLIDFNVGNLYILIATFSWAVYGILGYDFLRKYREEMNEIELTIINIWVGTGMLFLGSLMELSFFDLFLNISRLDVFSALVFMGIFSSGLGYIWWYESIKIIGTAKTAIFMNVILIMAMLIEFFLYQNLSVYKVIGGLCVITGVSITIYK
jgi:drug/metabolite transporter (DMT)-like permease